MRARWSLGQEGCGGRCSARARNALAGARCALVLCTLRIKYLHCVVFCFQAVRPVGGGLTSQSQDYRINWKFISVLSEMWYFRPQQSLRRTDNTSVLSSGTHEKAALSGRLAYRLRCRRPASQLGRRRSLGTFVVPLYTAWLRQVFPGQQSPSHIPPFLCCQGPLCKRSMCLPFKRVFMAEIFGSCSGSGSCRNHFSLPGLPRRRTAGRTCGLGGLDLLRRRHEARGTRHEARGTGGTRGFR